MTENAISESQQFHSWDIKYFIFLTTEAVAWKCSVRKGALENFSKLTRKHLHQSLL